MSASFSVSPAELEAEAAARVAGDAAATAALASHEADTSAVHGIVRTDRLAKFDPANTPGTVISAVDGTPVLGGTSAVNVTFTPGGAVAANNVQDAIIEVDSEKIAAALVDAKGDLIVATAPDTVARLPVGANDFVLTADSGQAAGVKWAATATASAVAVPNPAAQNLKGWSFDPTMASAAGQSMTTETRYAFVYLPGTPTTLANLLCRVQAAASAITSGFGLIYSPTGTLIARTADQATVWNSGGVKTMPLTAEAGQSITNLTHSFVIAALAVTGATGLQMSRKLDLNDSTLANVGRPTIPYRLGFRNTANIEATYGAPTTVFPASETLWLAVT